jgi:phosphatidylserine/phosphatidylglycerophosphate/cardiolipin synthase-like enzyme
VFTGSANWTNNALHYNDEYLLRVWDSSVYYAFLKHWDKVRVFAKASIGARNVIIDADGVRIHTAQASFEKVDDGGG